MKREEEENEERERGNMEMKGETRDDEETLNGLEINGIGENK